MDVELLEHCISQRIAMAIHVETFQMAWKC